MVTEATSACVYSKKNGDYPVDACGAVRYAKSAGPKHSSQSLPPFKTILFNMAFNVQFSHLTSPSVYQTLVTGTISL